MTIPRGMLPSNVIQNLSSIAERVFDQLMKLERPTNTTGAWGTNSESFSLIADNVPCLVGDPKGGMLSPLPNVIGEMQQTLIQTQSVGRGGPDVQVNDKVTIYGQTVNGVAAPNRVMRVQSVGSPQSYGMLLGFKATEVR